MLQQANHYDDCKVCFLLPCTCMVACFALLYKVVANGALKFDLFQSRSAKGSTLLGFLLFVCFCVLY